MRSRFDSISVPRWFETRGGAALLTMREWKVLLRSIADATRLEG